MSFSNSSTDLNQIISLTTYLGEADNLIRAQSLSSPSYDMDDVKYASTTALTAVYSVPNMTLTGSAALAIDSASPPINSRVLIKNQSAAAENGVYTVTSSGGSSFVLTRADDFDTVGKMNKYSRFLVESGSVNAGLTFFMDSTVTSVGTSSVTFSQYPSDSTSKFLVAEFRKQFDKYKSEAEFDNARAVVNSARSIELGLSAAITGQFASVCTALNNFYTTQYESSFKSYFANVYSIKADVWTDNFRTLWRNSLNQELVVKLGSVTKSGGSWAAFSTSGSKTITLDSALNIKIKQAQSGAEAIPVTIVLKDAANNTYVSTVNLTAGAVINTNFAITTAAKSTFTSIQSVTISNTYGSNGDIFEFWVSA